MRLNLSLRREIRLGRACTRKQDFHSRKLRICGRQGLCLGLEAKEVERWISSDEIVVKTEANVFQIAQKWVEHNKTERRAAFKELLCHVCLVFVSRDYLLNVVTNELVRDNPGCLKLVLDAIKQTTFSSDDDHSQSPRKGLDTRAIVPCGEEYALCYVPQENEWKGLPNRSSHTSQYVAKADRFDITKKKWEEITEMQQARGGAFGMATQGNIFVPGGADEENTVLKTCEVYNVATNEWQLFANLNVYRTHGSMVCLGEILYVLGGLDQTKKKAEHSVECYQSKQGKWIVKTTIPVEEDWRKKYAFKGCVLKFSRGVLDYLDDVIEEDY
ncbi:kelch-like protein 2 [Stylophora pistillata]|uniref:kelch-like protein 2 n=1 Tax=Stylophora pistillata TaxID=50429 RepID=UPI000C048AD5|nr:kelch-like protein 2 [Stylophora pistillata]